MSKTIEPPVWNECYGESWKDIIVPEAFAHPAKFSKTLIERIIDHGLERGYWSAGQTIGDPFGGVGLGGISCAYRGLRWIGCELEPRFVALAEQNFELHRSKLTAMARPLPQIIQGDSRFFDLNVEAVITSPPYADGCAHTGGNDPHPERMQGGKYHGVGIDGAITSPPYATIASGAGGLNTLPAKNGQQGGRNPESASQDTDQRYGESAGQIARLKEGTVEAVITSPPYADSINAGKSGIDWDKTKDGRHRGEEKGGCQGGAREEKYGTAPGQIGALKSGGITVQVPELVLQNVEPRSTQPNTTDGKPEDYWQAVHKVYASCFRAMKPGGVFACVVKAYVSKGKIVDLPEDTLKLLNHCGFETLERVRAMLVKTSTEGDLFQGTTTKKKERKSFFRRLAEKKGSPPIDFEEVLFVLKPHSESGGGIEGVITSPPYEGTHVAEDMRVDKSQWGSGTDLCKSPGKNYGPTPGQIGNLKAGKQ